MKFVSFRFLLSFVANKANATDLQGLVASETKHDKVSFPVVFEILIRTAVDSKPMKIQTTSSALWMLQYNIIKNGSNAGVNFTENISVIQRKGGITVTGELDFETKKLLVIPRCGNTDDSDEDEEQRPIEGRSRRARRQLSS